jgi:nitronate monooxygenase
MSERAIIGEEAGRPIYLFSTDSPLRSMTGDFGAMALYAGTGVGSLRAIVPAAERINEIVVAAEQLLATTEVDETAPSSSGVCYAGEMSGVYLGTLEPDELAAAMKDVASSLVHLLQATLKDSGPSRFDAPPFAWDTSSLAAWTVRLRMMAGGTKPFGKAASRADLPELARRLGDLAPVMPDGKHRETISKLRRVLTERAAGQVMRTLQLSLTS